MTTTAIVTSPQLGPLRPRKRSTRMSNSTRGKLYRSRRKKYTDGLGEYVESLRKEVEDLELYRRTQHATLYHSRHLSTSSPFARTVCEYFSLFEYGVPVMAAGLGVTRDALVRSSRQVGFLDSMVAPDFLFGGVRGVRMLLEQWERYSMYHLTLRFQLQQLEVVVSDAANAVVSAKAVLRVRFSRLTIEKVFPHVLWNTALVQRLIGLEVEYLVGNTFFFGSDGRLAAYDTEVDFLSAFTSVLGSIEDAIELVGLALIKEQHMIGEEDERMIEANVAEEETAEVAARTQWRQPKSTTSSSSAASPRAEP
ncbi:hypothetical protein PybrP1_010642 [[Pythium] brassicae (nom. inval.)]|nr:hypothetical protein PybrP1_010642 [[Pythium] brassicae (nom. inval.)]